MGCSQSDGGWEKMKGESPTGRYSWLYGSVTDELDTVTVSVDGSSKA